MTEFKEPTLDDLAVVIDVAQTWCDDRPEEDIPPVWAAALETVGAWYEQLKKMEGHKEPISSLAIETLRKHAPEIETLVAVSTGHVDHETAEALDSYPQALGYLIVCPHGDYGWQIQVPTLEDADQIMKILHDESPSLAECLRYAKDRGCHWLLLDQDAELCSALMHYSW